MLHYYIAKKTAAETYRLLVEIYVEHAPSIATCKDWFCQDQGQGSWKTNKRI